MPSYLQRPPLMPALESHSHVSVSRSAQMEKRSLMLVDCQVMIHAEQWMMTFRIEAWRPLMIGCLALKPPITTALGCNEHREIPTSTTHQST